MAKKFRSNLGLLFFTFLIPLYNHKLKNMKRLLSVLFFSLPLILNAQDNSAIKFSITPAIYDNLDVNHKAIPHLKSSSTFCGEFEVRY